MMYFSPHRFEAAFVVVRSEVDSVATTATSGIDRKAMPEDSTMIGIDRTSVTIDGIDAIG